MKCPLNLLEREILRTEMRNRVKFCNWLSTHSQKFLVSVDRCEEMMMGMIVKLVELKGRMAMRQESMP